MSAVLQRVEAATVRLTRGGAQGVLVPGGFVITAAHCVEWSATGGMALGDHTLAPVETMNGKRFLLSVAAVEPCADIAVLECPDAQLLEDDANAFEDWAGTVAPVPLCAVAFAANEAITTHETIAIHVLTHDRGWIDGRAIKHGSHRNGRIRLEPYGPIKNGTSGGPVVDATGALVGVVSTGDGPMPLVCAALPRWVLAAIQKAATRRVR